jgi:hypothetical protein
MKPIVPDGGYFILADYSQLGLFKKKKFSFLFGKFFILNSR